MHANTAAGLLARRGAFEGQVVEVGREDEALRELADAVELHRRVDGAVRRRELRRRLLDGDQLLVERGVGA